jgi:hypothetical protein
MQEKYQHGPLPIEKTNPGRTATWFLDNPRTCITAPDLNQFTDWNGVYTEDNVRILIYQTRSVIREKLHSAGRILTIRGNYGYAYYPAVTLGEHISPDGYRPIPNWEGDPTRIAGLQELFTGFRYAVVKPDIQTAYPLLLKKAYKYLVVLSHAYAVGQAADVDKILLDTGIPYDALPVYRHGLNDFLKQKTAGKWTIEHKRATRDDAVGDGVDLLVRVSTVQSGSEGSSSPPSLSAT